MLEGGGEEEVVEHVCQSVSLARDVVGHEEAEVAQTVSARAAVNDLVIRVGRSSCTLVILILIVTLIRMVRMVRVLTTRLVFRAPEQLEAARVDHVSQHSCGFLIGQPSLFIVFRFFLFVIGQMAVGQRLIRRLRLTGPLPHCARSPVVDRWRGFGQESAGDDKFIDQFDGRIFLLVLQPLGRLLLGLGGVDQREVEFDVWNTWIVAVAVLFSSQNPLLFHGRFLLQIAVIGHVAVVPQTGKFIRLRPQIYDIFVS